MKPFTIRILPDVVSLIRHLAPALKTQIRQALEALANDPWRGKPLQRELQGLYSYRVSRYRIIYRIRRQELLIEVIDIAQRAVVYDRAATHVARWRR